MAKVGTERIYHKGSGKEIYCQVDFRKKDKLFILLDFPEEIKLWYGSKLTRENTISSRLHQGEITGKSYDDCVNLGIKVYSEYNDLSITEERLILYKYQVNHPKQKLDDLSDRRDIYHAPCLAIGIEYMLMNRIRIGEESFLSRYTYEEAKYPEEGVRLGADRLIREDSNFDWNTNWHKIPYTEQAHAFFESTTKGLQDLILKANSFFGDSPEILLERIQQGKLLN